MSGTFDYGRPKLEFNSRQYLPHRKENVTLTRVLPEMKKSTIDIGTHREKIAVAASSVVWSVNLHWQELTS